jgi:hypothetical protein
METLRRQVDEGLRVGSFKQQQLITTPVQKTYQYPQ